MKKVDLKFSYYGRVRKNLPLWRIIVIALVQR